MMSIKESDIEKLNIYKAFKMKENCFIHISKKKFYVFKVRNVHKERYALLSNSFYMF